MSITGESDGDPMRHGVALADVLTGKDAAIAVLAALAARGRTGIGRHVQVSLKSTAEAALINVAQNAMVTGRPPTRWGNAHPNLVPYQLFHAADRPFVVAVGSDAQWQGCARALELAELGSDEALTTNAGRIAHRERLIRTVAERITTASATTWCTRLDAEGVPCGIVRTVPEVLAHIDASAQMGLPPSVPGTVRLPPPKLGEHTDIVRKDGWKAFSLASQTRR
jgi:crotonobetainyl-CoA:carnitine CoA-transferase CaiB-like acyl-CoA transferase